MAFNYRNPGTPAASGAFASQPVRENFEDIAQHMLDFPGSDITDRSIPNTALALTADPINRDAQRFAAQVVSGGLPGGFTGFDLTVPAGTAFADDGTMFSIVGQAFTVLASKDTYFSVGKTGVIDTPQSLTLGAAGVLPAGSQWLFKVTSGASAITSITDLRNLSPLKPNTVTPAMMTGVKLFGFASGNTTPLTSNFKIMADSTVVSLSGNLATITFSTPFPTATLTIMVCEGDPVANGFENFAVRSFTASSFVVQSTIATGNSRVNWIAIGY